MGWRGPLSRPVSLMTGALRLAAGWLVWAAAGTAIHTAIATPTPTLPPLFVIRSARWRLDRCVCGTACGRRNVAPPRKRAQVGDGVLRPDHGDHSGRASNWCFSVTTPTNAS